LFYNYSTLNALSSRQQTPGKEPLQLVGSCAPTIIDKSPWHT